eukprot:GILJ01008997.1.p1 GENE.GILJ01008997.1~~GILJ01008997.1.p1  ORF type:complete len:327 (-),score=37.95 GILJ01008997.1:128-1108(-)
MDGSQTFQNVTNCLQQFINQCENEKQAFKQQCEQKFKEFRERLERSTQQTLENERRVLRDLRQALDDEIASMQKLPARQNDVVSVNCGGKTLMVKRSTLCAVEGSVLASMFSGRWEEGLEKDDKGNVFLDFNPECFLRIVNWLRLRLLEGPELVSPPSDVPADLRLEFEALVQYLGLETIFPPQPLKFDSNNGPVIEDGMVVKMRSFDGSRFIMITGYDSISTRRQGAVIFSVRLETLSSTAANNSRIGFSEHKLAEWCDPAHGIFYRNQGLKEGDIVKCCFEIPSKQVSFYLNGRLELTSQATTACLFPCIYIDSSSTVRLVASD